MPIRLRKLPASLQSQPRARKATEPRPATVDSVTYVLPLPLSVNNLYPTVRGGKRVKSSAYRKWIADSTELVKSVGLHSVASPVSVIITIEGGTGFNRGRDIDNFLKVPLDLMKRLGVIENDSVKHVREVRACFVSVDGESRAVVTVRHLTGVKL